MKHPCPKTETEYVSQGIGKCTCIGNIIPQSQAGSRDKPLLERSEEERNEIGKYGCVGI
jgi:hypothetical protein